MLYEVKWNRGKGIKGVIMDIPNRIEHDGSSSGVICLQCLDMVLQAFGRHSAHVDDEGASQLGQVSGLFGVVGHDGASANSKGDVGGKVLHNLSMDAISQSSFYNFLFILHSPRSETH